MTRREQVYKAIDEERDYQDNLGPDRTDHSSKSVGDYITMLSEYHRRSVQAWTNTRGNRAALHEIRKIAAIAVRCMEEHGIEPRVW